MRHLRRSVTPISIALVTEMQEARKAKNFSRADAIRGQLNEQGIIVEITKDGARWRRK